jgi:hypothetical protein
MPVKLWFTMNHGGCAVPYELSKNRAKGIDPYSMLSLIKFLAPVWRRVTPVSDFQATLGYEYIHAQIENEFKGNLTTVRLDTFPNKLC